LVQAFGLKSGWVAALILFVSCAVGCASSKPRGAADPMAERVDTLPGATLVVPLGLVQVDPWHSLVARIDGGSRLEAKFWQVVVRAPASGEAAEDTWLPAPGVWGTRPPNSRERSHLPTGTWVAVVAMPADGKGRILTLGKRAYLINWLPLARVLPRADPANTEPLLDPWRAVADESMLADASLLLRARPEAVNPLTRWRFNLLINGLRADAASPDAPAFKDPVIEAIARQNEDRWRVALAWLWSASPELAARVKQRLAAVVDFGNHTVAPAWSVDHVGLDRLLADLLNSAITPERRIELAEAWLTDQAGGVVWIVDDGGLLDDQRRAIIPTVAIANLQDRRTLVWAAALGAPGAPEPNPVPSMATLKLVVPPATRLDDGPAPTRAVVAHVGRWSAEVPALAHKLPVTPPGFPVGPLLKDYSMVAWEQAQSGAAPALVGPDWATAAMLHRPAPDPSAPPSAAQSRRWELLVECRTSTSVTSIESLKKEAVRLFIGPSARPTAILRVDLTGTVTNETPRDPMAPPEMAVPLGRVEVSRAVDRWSFRLSLPPGAIESDGLLRIGMTRVDALGRRSAWPRPMLPWQQEPGRAALDTKAWRAGAEEP
jgi:hypothetical protein